MWLRSADRHADDDGLLCVWRSLQGFQAEGSHPMLPASLPPLKTLMNLTTSIDNLAFSSDTQVHPPAACPSLLWQDFNRRTHLLCPLKIQGSVSSGCSDAMDKERSSAFIPSLWKLSTSHHDWHSVQGLVCTVPCSRHNVTVCHTCGPASDTAF